MKNINSNWYALRWSILARDKFTCQYCGQLAPNVVLHVDHIAPRSNGGSDMEENLITACSACNLGKNLTPLAIGNTHIISNSRADPSLIESIVAYLTEHGPSTGTSIAKALKRNRSNIASSLSTNPLFRRVGKLGRNTLYDV